MITLSDRLKAIAEKIKRGETMADIGTDHGFLPLYLYENGISPIVIMTDVSRYSLEKSIENARQEGMTMKWLDNGYEDLTESEKGKYSRCGDREDGIYARCGDGLEVLKPGEVDAVVMAGIGGNLMEEILEKDQEKSSSFSRYILQPRRHPGRIRHYLIHNGYVITNESIVREGKFLCEIITAQPEKYMIGSDSTKEEGIVKPLISDPIKTNRLTADEKMLSSSSNSICWEVPSWYACLDDPLACEYVERKLMRERMILDSKKASEKADTQETKCNIMYLENLLQTMNK